MFTPLTYLGFLVVVIGPPLVALAYLTRNSRSRQFLTGSALVAAIGLLYTTPWDNALIARDVWWYGEGVVIARIYLAPVEEYLFIALQPVLTALWVAFLRSRLASESDPLDTWVGVSNRARAVGAVAGAGVTTGGLLLLATPATFYLGAILAWAGPVLAIQWAFGWQYLWRNRRLTGLAILVPTAYLAAADRVAIELGLWTISPTLSTGVFVAGLPVEEGLFFLLTNVFVVQGLLLYCWVLDRPTTTEAAASAPVAPNP